MKMNPSSIFLFGFKKLKQYFKKDEILQRVINFEIEKDYFFNNLKKFLYSYFAH